MALTPTPNFGSQLDRAIVAYLVSQGLPGLVVPAAIYGGMTYPVTKVHSVSATANPVNTLNKEFMTDITCISSAVIPNSQADAQTQWAALNNMVGLVEAAMLQSNDTTLDVVAKAITAAGNALATGGSPENADMAQFTLLHLYFRGDTRGKPDDGSCAWMEVRHFECHGFPSAVNP